MPVQLPYNFQTLDTSTLSDATDSSGDVTGKAVPASYLDANFDQLAQVVNVGSTAPSSPYEGMLWLDTSTGIIKQYDGTQWISKVSLANNADTADTADTIDGFHASKTPNPNVIVPLNAAGILDLSATYVRSDVYRFRRVDLTNATNDYMLKVGEEAYISFSDTTSKPLKIETQSETYYECHLVCSNTGGTSGGGGEPIYLNPNNTTYSDSFVYADTYRSSVGADSSYTTYSAFRCGLTLTSSVFYITNFVQYKNVKGIYDVYGRSNGYPLLMAFSTDWRDTTTSWTSLGTIVFPQDSSGYIIVRRLV